MPERAPMQRFFLVAAVALLVCWPPLHMGLSAALGFSPWKFFGWGMYATPYAPKNQYVYAYIVPDTVASLEGAEPRTARPRDGGWVFEWTGKAFERRRAFRGARALDDRADLVKVVRSAKTVEALARSIDRAFEMDVAMSESRAVILVVQPRLHPLKKLRYAEIDLFTVKAGRVGSRERLRSDRHDVSAAFRAALESTSS